MEHWGGWNTEGYSPEKKKGKYIQVHEKTFTNGYLGEGKCKL